MATGIDIYGYCNIGSRVYEYTLDWILQSTRPVWAILLLPYGHSCYNIIAISIWAYYRYIAIPVHVYVLEYTRVHSEYSVRTRVYRYVHVRCVQYW